MRRTAAAIALIALTIAGCGSSAAPTTTTTTAKRDARDKAVRFAECVRAHGVPHFPDPDTKGDFNFGVDVSAAVFSSAVRACKALQPPGSLSSKRTPKQQAKSLTFAACVRRQGVKDFPDPVQGQPVINTYKIPSSNRPGGMAILNAAIHACAGAGQ